jgi:hypothetical protein
MIICLEVWQAVIAVILFALVFTWAGYATAKVFMFSERDIKQRKHIHSLKLLVEHLQDEKYEAKEDVIVNGRTDSGRNKNNTTVKK